GLADAFQIVHIEPFGEAAALRVLDQVALNGARNQRVETSNQVVAAILRLFRCFRPYDALPGRAVNFTTELIQRAAAQGGSRLDEAAVLERFKADTGLPGFLIRDEETLR